MLNLLRKKEPKPSPTSNMGITSLVGKGATVRGPIELDSGIKIMGRVLGDVIIKNGHGVVLLHAESEVKGAIVADRVFVGGRVTGSISAKEVHLYRTANVDGAVSYSNIVIHDGAILNGFAHYRNKSISLERISEGEVDVIDH